MALSRVPGDDEIFVGGIHVLNRKSTMEDVGITHILSVMKYDFKDFQDWEKYAHMSVEVDDMEDENLLGEFERTGSFIEKGLKEGKDGKEGKVLIHCAMGKSRSVTIAIAFLLRKYSHHTVASALDLIREARAIAEPNEGFMAQLELYKDMGCPRDIDAQPRYQRWLYQKEVELSLAAGMAPDTVRFEDEHAQAQSEHSSEQRQTELRCKRCRRTLATTPYFDQHVPNQPKKAAPSRTDPITSLTPAISAPDPLHTCTHHFLHPLSWMRPELEKGLLSGRLECPNAKCSAKLGTYAWQGMKCSCGRWVCPAFSIQRGRVDEAVLAAGTGGSPSSVRQPPGFRQEKM